jgi:hypothetical protein
VLFVTAAFGMIGFVDDYRKLKYNDSRGLSAAVKYTLQSLAALVAAGFPVGGVIHLYRDPVDFVVSSMRNTGKSGWGGLSEHALRYRLYHARARQVSRSMPELVLHYEHLADDIDSQLERLFRFLAVQPMTVSQLQEYFDQEWHFMGNASLFGFDGIIKASRHRLEPAPRAFVRALARRAGG